MFREKHRYGQDPDVVVRSKAQTWNKPLRWDREAAAAGVRALVFTCSWSDWFIKEAAAWRAEAWAMVKRTPHLIYQILTKRPSRILANLPPDWGAGYENVWLGVSAENQAEFDRRVPVLLGVPARVRFASVEPQLGLVSLAGIAPALTWRRDAAQAKAVADLHWIIYGGESGSVAESRPTDPAWIRQGVQECLTAGIAPFVKQLGSPWARSVGAVDTAGADPAEWPEDLRVQRFPAGFAGTTAPLALSDADAALVPLTRRGATP